MNTPTWSRWGARGTVIVLLVVAYATIWRPARAVLTRHLAYPVLTSVDTERARTFNPTLKAGGLSIALRSSEPSVSGGAFRAPVGILFLLPALFLVAFFPYRPYWFYFWGVHLVLGLLQLGAVALGVGWTDWGFVLNSFLRGYVVQGVSLAAPIVALYLSRTAPPSGVAASRPHSL